MQRKTSYKTTRLTYPCKTTPTGSRDTWMELSGNVAADTAVAETAIDVTSSTVHRQWCCCCGDEPDDGPRDAGCGISRGHSSFYEGMDGNVFERLISKITCCFMRDTHSVAVNGFLWNTTFVLRRSLWSCQSAILPNLNDWKDNRQTRTANRAIRSTDK